MMIISLQLVDSTVKENPGKDQNKVVSALHEATYVICSHSNSKLLPIKLLVFGKIVLGSEVAVRSGAPRGPAGQDLQIREQDV